MGGGITHALGTGGRDLSEQVGSITARQGLDLLNHDPETKVIVLVSKPPSPRQAGDLVNAARLSKKPVVVDFIGYATATRRVDNVRFATSFDEAAELAVQFATAQPDTHPALDFNPGMFAPEQRYLRGLFSGGTLAYETLLVLRDYLPRVYSNAPLDKQYRLADSLTSQEHTILDLGEDEFTVGRLHPMMDNDLRIRRLEIEANDPAVAVILIDLVLGFGAHPDPASELAPIIRSVCAQAKTQGRHLEVVAVVTGTDEDPQDFNRQVEQLAAAGVKIFYSNDQAARYAGQIAERLDPDAEKTGIAEFRQVELGAIQKPLAAINVGLETFTESLTAQSAQVIQVDWRPPASGNERLMAILERMKSK
jgi:FdrA protein